MTQPIAVPALSDLSSNDVAWAISHYFPAGGRRVLPLMVNWANDVPLGNGTLIDLEAMGLYNFRSIGGISIDNSDCSCPVVVYCPDTQQQVQVPALAYADIPLWTATSRVALWPLGPSASGTGDQTNVQMLNFPPDPIMRPGGVPAFGDTFGTTFVAATIVPDNIRGILTAWELSLSGLIATPTAGVLQTRFNAILPTALVFARYYSAVPITTPNPDTFFRGSGLVQMTGGEQIAFTAPTGITGSWAANLQWLQCTAS